MLRYESALLGTMLVCGEQGRLAVFGGMCPLWTGSLLCNVPVVWCVLVNSAPVCSRSD